MINTVIFDIGNVLVSFDWGEYIYDMFEDKDTCKAVRNALFGSDFWNELDRGVLTREEMLSGFFDRAPGYEKEIELAFDNVGQALAGRSYTVPLINELKDRGCKVLYLSNYSRHVMNANPEVLDFIKYTDGGVFSCDVKLIKPDPKIFGVICEKYDLSPEECVFIDDNAANILAAGKFGMKTIHFQNYDQAYRELCALLASDRTDEDK